MLTVADLGGGYAGGTVWRGYDPAMTSRLYWAAVGAKNA
jgi:hypothetical protein